MVDIKIDPAKAITEAGLKEPSFRNILGAINQPRSTQDIQNLNLTDRYNDTGLLPDTRSLMQQFGDLGTTTLSSGVNSATSILGAIGGANVYRAGGNLVNAINTNQSNYLKQFQAEQAQKSNLVNSIYDQKRSKATSLFEQSQLLADQVSYNVDQTSIGQAAANVIGSAIPTALLAAVSGGALGPAGVTGAIAASTASESGGQAAQEILGKSNEELMKSPLYPALLEKYNGNQELATNELIDITSREVNLDPSNLLISGGLSKFGNLIPRTLAKGNVLAPINKAKDLGIEAVVDSLEEVNTTVQSNKGIQANVDPSKQISEGLVESGVQGLIGTSVTSTPSFVGNTVKSGLNTINEITAKPEDKEVNKVEQDITTSVNDIINQTKPTSDIPNTETNNVYDTLKKSALINKNALFEAVSDSYPSINKDKIFNSLSKDGQDVHVISAIKNLINDIEKDKFKDNKSKLEAATLFNELTILSSANLTELSQTTKDGTPLKDSLNSYQKLIDDFKNTAKYQNAIKSLETITQDDDTETQDILASGSDEDIVLNQRKITNLLNTTKTVFENNPQGISKKTIDALYNAKERLKQSSDITDDNIAFIDNAYKFKQDEEAANTVNEEINSNIDDPDELTKASVDSVSYQISDIGKADGKKSLVQHVKGITNALNSETKTIRNQDGIGATADELINNLGGFAGHMKRKAEAAIQSIEGGKGEPVKFAPFGGFRQYNKDAEKSKASIYVNTKNKNSRYTGLAVFNDAYSTINTYNNMVKEAQRQGLQLETELLELPKVPDVLLKDLSNTVRERFSNIAPVQTESKVEPVQETVSKPKSKKKTESFRKVKSKLTKVTKPINDPVVTQLDAIKTGSKYIDENNNVIWDKKNKTRGEIKNLNGKRFAYNNETKEYVYGNPDNKIKLKVDETVSDVVAQLENNFVVPQKTKPIVNKPIDENSPPPNTGEGLIDQSEPEDNIDIPDSNVNDVKQVTKTDKNITNDKVTNNVASSGSDTNTQTEPTQTVTEEEESYYTDEDDLSKTYKTKQFKEYTQKGNSLKKDSFKTFFPSVKNKILNKKFYSNILTDLDKLINTFNPFVFNRLLKEGDEEQVLNRFNDFITSRVETLTNDLTQAAIDASEGKAVNGKSSIVSQHLKYLLNSDNQLDEDLIYKTVLAYTDWSLNLSTAKLTVPTTFNRENNNQEVAEYIGIGYDSSDVHTMAQEVYALTNTIKKYWGVNENNKSSQTFTQGIPELLAKYLINSSDEFEVKSYYLDKETKTNSKEFEADVEETLEPEVKKVKPTPSNIIVFKPFIVGADTEITDYVIYKELFFDQTNFIKLITDNKKDIAYSINEPIKEIDLKIANRLTKITKKTAQAVKNIQDIKYKLNKPILDLYNRIGKENLQFLFNPINNDPKKYNIEYRKTIEGKNLTNNDNINIALSIGSELDVLNDLEAGVYFKNNVTAVNRIQEEYAGPRANKVIRELVIPERYTIDLNNDLQRNWFKTTIAQNLGLVKLNKLKSFEEVDTALKEFIKLPAIKTYFDYLNNPSMILNVDFMVALKEVFGNNLTAANLHALQELNKYLNEKNNPTLTSMLQLEIDGMANGYNNALMNYNITSLNQYNQLLFMRGGIFLNTDYKSSNDFFNNFDGDKSDSYGYVNKLTKDAIDPNGVDEFINLFPEVRSQFIPLMQTAGMIDTDNTSLTRDEIKNKVMTVTYASGSLGISKKLTGTFVENIYKKLTSNFSKLPQAERQQILDTLVFALSFGNLKTYINKYYDPELKNNVRKIAREYTRKSKKEIITIQNDLIKRFNKPQEFKLNRNEFIQIASVFEAMFGAEIYTQTKSSLGSANRVLTAIQKFTNLQSEVAKFIYGELVNKYLQEINKSENLKKDGTVAQTYYISKDQENEIFKYLQDQNILTDLVHENYVFDLGTSDKELAKGTTFSFDPVSKNTHQTDSYVSGVRPLGVAFNASANIGNGDGGMVQDFYNEPANKELIKTTSHTYDGIHSSPNNVSNVSEAINKSVWKTYQENHILPVAKQGYNFVIGIINYLRSQTIQKQEELLKIIDATTIDLAEEKLINNITELFEYAAQKQSLIEVTRDHVNVTINQMAGGQTSYVHKAEKEQITNSSTLKEKQAKLYNQYFDQFTQDAVTNGTALESKEEGFINQFVNKLREIQVVNIAGINAGNNDVELFDENLYNTLKQYENDKGQIFVKDIISELSNLKNITNSLLDKIIKLVDPSTIIYLRNIDDPNKQSLEELKTEVTGSDTPIGNGIIHVSGSTKQMSIFINNVSSETLAHELNHAVHIELFIKYYSKNGEGLTEQQIEYVKTLELLKQEFLDIDSGNEVITQVQDLVNSIDPVENMVEFLSWSLTNKKLKDQLKKQKISNTLLNKIADIAKTVFDTLVQFIFNSDVPNKQDSKKDLNNLYDAILFTYLRALPKEKQDTSSIDDLSTIELNQQQLNTFEEINYKIDSLTQRYMDKLSKLSDPNKAVFTATVSKLVAQTEHNLNELDKVFNLSDLEKITFKNLSNLFSLGVKNKSFNLNKLQKVYTQFINEIDYKDFMVDGTLEDVAKAQFDALTKSNEINQTNNLGSFLALSQINSNIQNKLSKITFKVDKNNNVSVADKLNNLKTELMNKIDPVDIEGNADYVMNKIVNDFINSDLDALHSLTQLVQNKFDIDTKITEAVTQGINKITKKDFSKIFTSGAVSIFFDDISKLIARNDYIPQFVKDLSKELIGKTITSENIEDLMNIVKQKVQSVKSGYRNVLPSYLKEEFKTVEDPEIFKNLTNTVGKTDIFSLGSTRSFNEVIRILSTDKNVQEEISIIEKRLNKDYIRKSKQLANYLITGSAGFNLLTNANSISILAGENNSLSNDPSDNVIQDIDHLVSLYAFQKTDTNHKQQLRDLIKNDTKGIQVLTSYLVSIQQEENNKTLGSEINKYARRKGYLPFDIRDGKRLIIAKDSNKLKLQEDGFVRVGDYIDPVSKDKKGYYLSSVIGSPYQQGILQTISNSINGMNIHNGQDMTGQYQDFITDSLSIDKIYDVTKNNPNTTESYIPVIGSKGTIVAYQRNIRQDMLDLLKPETDLTKLIGIMKSRQTEEFLVQEFNNRLIDRTLDLYEKDNNKNNYTNIATSTDPIVKDTWSVIPSETKTYIESVFGKDKFFVRKDLMNNSLGYRLPSVSDIFTGKSRFSKDVRDTTQKMLRLLFGSNAYIYLKTFEDGLQEVVKYTKEWIYLKSIVVPAGNTASNVLQLKMNGVSSEFLINNGQKVFSELKLYHKNEARKIKINLLLASSDPITQKRLTKELESIEELTNRLSIKPLIDSGEFSAVNEGLADIDGLLSSENIGEFIKKQIDKIIDTKKANKKIPKSLRTVTRYAIISKDTDLYKGLVQAVLYSDYVAKAIYYNDLVENKNMNIDVAKRLVSEEFINYNFLPGRSRSYLESIGFLWFWNFKIRSVKIAGRMIVTNPFKALLGSIFASTIPISGIDTITGSTLVTDHGGIGFGNLVNPVSSNPFLRIVS